MTLFKDLERILELALIEGTVLISTKFLGYHDDYYIIYNFHEKGYMIYYSDSHFAIPKGVIRELDKIILGSDTISYSDFLKKFKPSIDIKAEYVITDPKGGNLNKAVNIITKTIENKNI